MHINTNSGGGGGSGSVSQRSNPSSPSAGSAGNSMEIAARHYEALQQYLLAHILKEKHGVSEQRVAAREKLSRLLQNQLQDLSTDVYDELKRRTDEAQVPFLAVRDDFHPKRNQARQKLATLPQNRFKDLASDVYVQLERQFPDLLEMFPLRALEERENMPQQPPQSQPQQQDRQDREPTTPVVQQSNVVPNVSTFTIQDSSNAEEEESYYRAPGQQAPPTPSALDGSVNFASLDSLMADLGNDLGNGSKDGGDSKDSAAINKATKGSQDNDLIRLPSKGADSKGALNGLGINTGLLSDQQEYETRIAALCKRLQHLESEVGDGVNRPEGSRLAQVERQLAKQTELYNEQTTKVTKLQLDYNKVFNDYHAQLETVDMVNQEVKALVMENKSLKQKHLDAEEELQLAYNKIKQLEDENNNLKADLKDSHQQQKRAQQEDPSSRGMGKDNNNAITATPISPISASVANGHGGSSHHDAHLKDHELENNAKVTDNDWSHNRQQVRNSLMVNPSSVVQQTNLLSFSNALDDLLSAGRSDSSSSVLMGMKSVVIACKAVTEDVEDYEHEMGQDRSFSELKQELSAGLTQLMTAARAHSNAFNEDEDEFDRTLGDLGAAADQLDAIVMDIVNVPKRGGADDEHHNSRTQQNGGGHYDHYDENQDLNEPNNSNNNAGADGEEEPLDALDLKIYLETQTGLIVASIQTLLSKLRSSSDPEDVSDASDAIIKVVDQVTRQTRMTLSTPDAVSAPQAKKLRSQGDLVLEDLESSLDLLIDMKEQLERDPELAQSSSQEAKSIKQKMASASFEIAKYAKELAGLVED
ncbi:component of the polarisome [Mortierella claussenii]|nr:component of the polarisome [Mortierella claussenii]